MKGTKIKRRVYHLILKYVLLVILFFITILPIFIMISTSLKTRVDAFSIPPVWFFKPTLNGYRVVFDSLPFNRYFINSCIIGILTTVFTCLFGVMAAYAIVRHKFFGRKALLKVILLLRMIAPVVLIIPIYIIWSKLGVVGSRNSVIFSYVAMNLPLAIWISRTFINEVPIALEEAAIIDGCNDLRIFSSIIAPLIKPGLVVVAIFTFRTCWNEFPLALVITDRFSRTLPVAITLFISTTGVDWSAISAIATIIAIPAFIFTFTSSKHIIKGLAAGAVKG